MNLVTNITLLTKKDQKTFSHLGMNQRCIYTLCLIFWTLLPTACHKNIIYLISLVELTEIAKYSTCCFASTR